MKRKWHSQAYPAIRDEAEWKPRRAFGTPAQETQGFCPWLLYQQPNEVPKLTWFCELGWHEPVEAGIQALPSWRRCRGYHTCEEERDSAHVLKTSWPGIFCHLYLSPAASLQHRRASLKADKPCFKTTQERGQHDGSVGGGACRQAWQPHLSLIPGTHTVDGEAGFLRAALWTPEGQQAQTRTQKE